MANDQAALLIDGNFLFMKLVFGTSTSFKTEADIKRFRTSFTTTLASIIRKYSSVVDSVGFVKDNKSWRKLLTPVVPVELTTDHDTYKANRQQDDSYVDWSKAFYVFDTIIDMLEAETSIQIYRVDGAEGDDWMWCISRIREQKNKHTIIYAADQDMYQLVSDKTYFAKQPTEALAMHASLKVDEAAFDHLFNQSAETMFVNQLRSSNMFKSFEYVRPVCRLLNKLVHGDPKDNVSPLFAWRANNRTYKPTWKHAESVTNMDALTIDNLYDEEWQTDFCKNLLAKTKQDAAKLEHTIRVFRSNLQLLALNGRSIPKDLIQAMSNIVIKQNSLKPKTDVKKWSDYRNYSISDDSKSFYTDFFNV